METPSSFIQKTAQYVRKKIYGDAGGQDWYHTERVWRMAAQLQALEGGNLRLIELAALLHDVGDYKHYNFNEAKGTLALRAIMDILEIDEESQKRLREIINETQYNSRETTVPSTIEGKIIQDADWLDSLGALGIARTFAMGGQLNRVIHDPNRRPRNNLSKEAYQRKKNEGTSFNHFYEKTLNLPALMNTKTGRAIAESRAQYLKQFMDEFLAEWLGER